MRLDSFLVCLLSLTSCQGHFPELDARADDAAVDTSGPDADAEPDADDERSCVGDCLESWCGPAGCDGLPCIVDDLCGSDCGACDLGVCCEGVCLDGESCCTDADCSGCSGMATPCPYWTTRDACRARLGCDWSENACGGDVECAGLGESECSACGCSWAPAEICMADLSAACIEVSAAPCDICGCSPGGCVGAPPPPCVSLVTEEQCAARDGCHWSRCDAGRCT